MTVEIYNALVDRIKLVKDGNGNPYFKTVKMFFNDYERELAKENDVQPFLKPACLIQFTEITCNQLGAKGSVQQCDFNTVLHLVWDIRLTDDLTILKAKQALYASVQNFELDNTQPTSSRFLRVAELPQPDYNTIIVYQQIYKSTFKDDTGANIPTIGTVADMTITTDIEPHL